MRATAPRPLFLSTLVFSALVVAMGCNDHRYGFFGDTEGESGFETATTEVTTTVTPTTVTPTTVTTTPTTVATTGDPTTPMTVTVSEPVTSVTTVGPGCGELVLPSIVPVQGLASLVNQGDAFGLSCGGVGGSDVAFVWRVPFSGRFVIDTLGSNFDTLLGVIEGECFGPELACNDDGGFDLSSRLEVDLFAGQVVTLAVDSFGGPFGDVVLNIAEVPIDTTCPDGDFGSQLPLEIPGQTAGAPNVRAGSCGGFDAPEIEARWTAPFAGEFVFEITQADFDPVLYMLSECEGFEFACSDNAIGLNPSIPMFFEAGQSVVLVVDGAGGGSGNFTLTINQL